MKIRSNTWAFLFGMSLFMGCHQEPEIAEKEVKTAFVSTSKTSGSLPEGVDSLSVIGVGDMMLGTNYPDGFLPPNDGKDLLTPVKHILEDADITFGNLEGVILTGSGQMKKCGNPALCYAFKSPDHYVNYFVEAGFDLLSIANNHVGDFGDIGRENTIMQLQKTPIKFAGLLTHPHTSFEKNGIKYGFAAFSPNNGTVNINDIPNAKQIVKALSEKNDVVIVSFHGGAEGASKRNITRKNEIFVGENRGNPYAFARAVIDAGADIVLGHGPHVTRAVDLYKNRFIAYSLGNFATYGRFNLKGVSGVAPIIKVFVNKEGEFLSARVVSIKQIGEGGPVLDETHWALREIQSLTQQDIPEASIIITDDGIIRKK